MDGRFGGEAPRGLEALELAKKNRWSVEVGRGGVKGGENTGEERCVGVKVWRVRCCVVLLYCIVLVGTKMKERR